jgi:hypothetical protein
MDRQILFFNNFYNECERPSDKECKQKKGRIWARSNCLCLEQCYWLAMAYLLTTIMYQLMRMDNNGTSKREATKSHDFEADMSSLVTWQALHREVSERLKYLKTMMTEDISWGIGNCGLEQLKCSTLIEGLTPKLLLEGYILRMG